MVRTSALSRVDNKCGVGTGSWIIGCAKVWKVCEMPISFDLVSLTRVIIGLPFCWWVPSPFLGVLCSDSHLAGLDIVPLHPDLQQIGSPDLASRITWVQDNL